VINLFKLKEKNNAVFVEKLEKIYRVFKNLKYFFEDIEDCGIRKGVF